MLRRFLPRLSAAGLIACTALVVVPLYSQDNDPPPAAAAARDANAQQEYEKTLGDWKALLKQLRELQIQRQTAQPDELPKLQQQWDAVVAKGNAMIPELRTKGLAAFKASPNTDRQLTRFLMRLFSEELAEDRYEEALQLGKELIEAGCTEKDLHNASGIAAFAVHDFDLAKQYLEAARKAGTINEEGLRYLEEIAVIKPQWEEEQKLRAAETEQDDLPRVKLATTQGDIVLELFEDQAPETVGNFVSLVEQEFYNGLSFHRVLAGFMAQGGCPVGDGSGGPGYKIYCETGREDHRNHFRGSLSMAKQQAKNTGGSQFFLCFRPTPFLNGEHTVFGRVVEGLDVLARLQRRNPEEKDAPDPDKIITAEVLRKRDHEYVPHKVQ